MDSSPFEVNPPASRNPHRGQSASPTPQGQPTRAETPHTPFDDAFSPIALRQSVLRSPHVAPSPIPRALETAVDISTESLRSELSSVKYELEMLREERALEKVRHEQETRALEAKVEEQAKRVDAVETEKRFLIEKQTIDAEASKKTKASAATAKQNFERQIRMLKSEIAQWKETVTDKQEEIDSEERRHKRELGEQEAKTRLLEQQIQDLSDEVQVKGQSLDEVYRKLAGKDKEVNELETELLKIKSQTGDADTLRVVQKELSEQVAHIRQLEATNRRQAEELKTVRESLRSLEIVEEEKRGLQKKVEMLEELRSELSSAQVRISVLEDQRQEWQAYFESEGLEFDTPQALARALIEERMERAALMEKLGRSDPQIAQKDEIISHLEGAIATLRVEVHDLQDRLNKDTRARQRLERQRALALREADFLREQVKSFSSEETIYMQGNYDEQKTERIQQLEILLEEYKAEIAELKAALKEAQPENGVTAGTKRRADDGDDERLGQLTRKNRQLQDGIEQLERKLAVAQKDAQALESRLKSMQGTSTRILELKDNPTSREEAIKTSQLKALQEENAALLAQLEGRPIKSVPIATLENARSEIKKLEKAVADKEKRQTRLKEIFANKATEFREAVQSLLGYKLVFMPNGRVRVTHMFCRNEDESIEFDGEKGTMKISGGPDSMFAREIRNQCQFWMPRQSIPCLLSSILLEQYEKTTRAQM